MDADRVSEGGDAHRRGSRTQMNGAQTITLTCPSAVAWSTRQDATPLETSRPTQRGFDSSPTMVTSS